MVCLESAEVLRRRKEPGKAKANLQMCPDRKTSGNSVARLREQQPQSQRYKGTFSSIPSRGSLLLALFFFFCKLHAFGG
jgi:hypothetical protein